MRKETKSAASSRIGKALAALLLTTALLQSGSARGGSHSGNGFQGGGGFHGGFHGGGRVQNGGGFHGSGFHGGIGGFTAEVFTAMASAAASAWLLRQPSVAPGWAPDWAGLITLTQTRATTATDLIASTGTAPTPKDFTRTYSSATPVGKQFPPTNVATILVGL